MLTLKDQCKFVKTKIALSLTMLKRCFFYQGSVCYPFTIHMTFLVHNIELISIVLLVMLIYIHYLIIQKQCSCSIAHVNRNTHCLLLPVIIKYFCFKMYTNF